MSQRSSPTANYRLNHTMIRIKDPEVSLKFYRDVLGMEVVAKYEFPKYTLHFLGYKREGEDEKEGAWLNREGLLELWHDHDTLTDFAFPSFHSGNTHPLGFGHIGIAVDDVLEACERFEKLGVTIKQPAAEGSVIAFILDPDGYWIEIIPRVVLPG